MASKATQSNEPVAAMTTGCRSTRATPVLPAVTPARCHQRHPCATISAPLHPTLSPVPYRGHRRWHCWGHPAPRR